MILAAPLIKKALPYIIIVVLGLAIFGGFKYYSNKIEELSRQNAVLIEQNAEINNNYNTLQNLYNISIKQVEELQKQQKESLQYVAQLKQELNGMNLKEAYEKDALKLLENINQYEKCYSLNTIKDPTYKCYKEK